MDIQKIKLIAFYLDGTLTQHNTAISKENREALDALGARYKLVMVGAGQVMRIFFSIIAYLSAAHRRLTWHRSRTTNIMLLPSTVRST